MGLALTRLENIALPRTIIIIPLMVSPLYLLLIVRLGGYIVNLCVFCSYRLIGKLTVFCSLKSSACAIQQWTLSLPPRRASFSSQFKSKVVSTLAKAVPLRIKLNLDGTPITLSNLSSINFVSIFRCSSSPRNPVYASRVDLSAVAFSLSSHRHSPYSPSVCEVFRSSNFSF